MIEIGHPELSVRRQCALLGIARSGMYYEPVGPSPEDLTLMRLLDEQYTMTPFYGVRKMTRLLHSLGYGVDVKRVRRLLRLEAIYPKPRLSFNGAEYRKFPYLLGGLDIRWPNQVWAADITYLRLRHGFAYSWTGSAGTCCSGRSPTRWRRTSCVSALDEALRRACPEISNTDQGVQFISDDFVGLLEKAGVRISMDGRGRFLDNIFVERLWRTVKYEDIYIHDYNTVADARDCGFGDSSRSTTTSAFIKRLCIRCRLRYTGRG